MQDTHFKYFDEEKGKSHTELRDKKRKEKEQENAGKDKNEHKVDYKKHIKNMSFEWWKADVGDRIYNEAIEEQERDGGGIAIDSDDTYDS